VTETLRGETVLITGGTGSFGRAFIRYVLARQPECVIVALSRNAEMRYRLEQAHLEAVKAGRLIVVPGDVRHPEDLKAVADYRPTIITHAAAEKFVGTGERFAGYTWSVNYVGAVNVVAFARREGVRRVLALSTDKATVGLSGEPPANEYGLSKQAAERVFLDANREGVCCALTRYGNVVASAGSVLPLFLEQRKAGVLTLTDARCTRFAMPLAPDGNGFDAQWWDGSRVQSAVGLVLDALAHMSGGETFVPRIPSHSVADLAAAVGGGCRIEEVGIRPGERLHEVLVSPSEASRTWERADGAGWVILPNEQAIWPSGRRVPAGFHFSSDQDPLPVEWQEAA